MTSQFIIKNFMKHKAVKIILIDDDKRIKSKFVIPEAKTVTITGKTFTLTQEATYYSEGVPTYVFSNNNIAPLDVERSETLPIDLNTILQSHIGRDIANASKGNKMELTVILSGVMIIGLVYIYYLMNKNFNGLNEQIEAIKAFMELANESVVTP